MPLSPRDGAAGWIARCARALRERWFAGITCNGILLVVLASVASALDHVATTAYAGEDWIALVARRWSSTFFMVSLTMLAVVTTINRAPATPRWRYPALALAVVSSTLAGMTIVAWLESTGWSAWLAEIANDGGIGFWLYDNFLFNGVRAFLFAAVFVFYRLREEHEAATRRAELDRADSERQLAEARLQMLQAQIEPHFLFNTLANVRRLYQTDAPAGEAMLQNLMRYLAVALPQMRRADSTLGREVELTESYLEIQRMRMGRRLAFEIDVPAALRSAAVPPMMLVTLVENAIKHGIGPLPEGGTVRVNARVDDGRLYMEVADSGQGFTKTSGGGTGLANIRARLAGLHGRAAQFTLTLNRPQGVVATIALPWPAGSAGGAA